MAILTGESSKRTQEPQLLIPEVEQVTRRRRRRTWLALAVGAGVTALVAASILLIVGGGSGTVVPRAGTAPLAGAATGTSAANTAARVCASRFTQPYSPSNPYSRNYVYAAYPTTVARLAAVNYMTHINDWPSYNAYPSGLHLAVCVIRNPVTGKDWTKGCPPKYDQYAPSGRKGIQRYFDQVAACRAKAGPGVSQDLWIVPIPHRYGGFAGRHPRAGYLPAELGPALFSYTVPPTGW
jgi:hypothetical protein